MNRIATCMAFALLPVLGTCCPTIWVQVEKDDPSPWPSVPLPDADPTPYTIPAGVPNRFDVLVRDGTPTLDAPDYSDTFDPLDPKLADNPGWTRAVAALDAIEHKYSPAARTCTVKATLGCARTDRTGFDARCHELRLPQPVTQAAAVVLQKVGLPIGGQLIAVRSPPSAQHPSNDLDLAEFVPGKNGDSVDVCIVATVPLSHTLLSFVHMSDIQLRDPSITLTDRRLSHALDWFDALSSFEYDEDMAFYNQYLVEATFLTINSIVQHPPANAPTDAPRFVIHTGDSIDAGAIGELDRFHVLIDRLHIPFFEMLGNHDVLVFGNLTPTSSRDTDQACTPVEALLGHETSLDKHRLCVDQLVACPTCIGHESDLVALDTQEQTRKHFIDELVHPRADALAQLPKVILPTKPYCDQTVPKVRYDAYSHAHGFDLGTQNDSLDGPRLGYYAFVQKLDKPLDGVERWAVLIALNSEDLADHRGGTRGRLGHAQAKWLRDVLSCVRADHPHDLVLVFAHQPLSLIDVEPDPGAPSGTPTPTVASILDDARPNVVGYLYGHNHWHSICGDRRCKQFWEVETASLIEFPQEGRLVRIKEIGNGLAFFELTALRERLASQDSPLARNVALARRGAERDFCYTQRETPKGRCSADQRPYRTDGHDASARLFFQLPP